MNKLSIFKIVGLIILSTNINASEFSYLYKDQRIMAAGGANVASGGYSSSIFSNPAGIAKVSNRNGVLYELIGTQVSVSGQTIKVVDDLNSAIDEESIGSILDVFSQYSGDTFHVDLSNYSSVTYNQAEIAWTLGILTAVDANLTPHTNSYNLLEVQARAYAGITTAISYTYQPLYSNELSIGDLSLGLGLKLISQKSYEGTLTPSELVNFDSVTGDLQTKMESNGSAVAADLGAIYQYNLIMRPSLAISVLNIGDLDFDERYGSQPMTVNIGAAIQPEVPFTELTKISIDYIDVFNTNKNRVYNLSDGDTVSFTDLDDTSIRKRVRFGVSSLIYDNSWSSLELAAGIYQGAYTAGVGFSTGLSFSSFRIKIALSTYQEQLGPEYGDQEDRRYLINFSSFW